MSSPPAKSSICASCKLEFDADAQFCPGCGKRKASSEKDPLLGTIIGGRYRILKKIGEGSTGVIFQAEHINLKRPVAIKVLHTELAGNELSVERFRREATSVGEIANRHIVEMFDFGRTDDDRLYLAMELLRGESLAAAIANGRTMPIDTVVDILVQLCDALMEAHAMGYVHRDLRPENVFLTNRQERDGFVKLLDFGLSKLVEQDGVAPATKLGMTFGDPRYMSPEQARGEAVDRRSDIYSLGCIAYQALTGKVPFGGDGTMDVLTAHIQNKPVAIESENANVPPWLSHVVMNMLEKDREKRFVTVFRLQQALRQGADSGAIMNVETVRRPESHPPPSVSRAMKKLTQRASSESEVVGPSVGAFAPAESVNDGPTELSGTAKGLSKQSVLAPSASGVSAAWYADGDALSEQEGASGSLPTSDSVVGPSPGASYQIPGDSYDYLEPPPARRRWLIPVGIACLLGVFVGVCSMGGGESDSDDEALVDGALSIEQEIPDVANGEEIVKEEVPPPVPSSQQEPPVVKQPVATPPVETPPVKTTPVETPPTRTAPRPEPRRSGTVPKTRTRKPRSEPTRTATKPSPPPRDPPQPDPDDTPVSTEDISRAEFFAKLGASALRRGDTLEAATQFNQARRVNPKNARASAGLGEIALQQGSNRAAVKHLVRATRLAPGNSRFHMLLGEAHLLGNNRKKASASFEQALRLDPDNDRARDGFNRAQ